MIIHIMFFIKLLEDILVIFLYFWCITLAKPLFRYRRNTKNALISTRYQKGHDITDKYSKTNVTMVLTVVLFFGWHLIPHDMKIFIFCIIQVED